MITVDHTTFKKMKVYITQKLFSEFSSLRHKVKFALPFLY